MEIVTVQSFDKEGVASRPPKEEKLSELLLYYDRFNSSFGVRKISAIERGRYEDGKEVFRVKYEFRISGSRAGYDAITGSHSALTEVYHKISSILDREGRA